LWHQHTFIGPRSKVVKHYKNSALASFATENLTLGRQIFKMKKGAQDELGWMAPFKFVGFGFCACFLPHSQGGAKSKTRKKGGFMT
jgi:hypothetical protein